MIAVRLHVEDGVDDAALGDLFDGVPDAIIVLDGAARVCFCNPSASTLLGVSTSEATGRPIASFLPNMPAPDGKAVGRRRLLLRPEGAEPRRIDVSVGPIEVVGMPWRVLLIARPAEHEPGVGALGPAALYDELTQLPSRALFTDRVEHAVPKFCGDSGGCQAAAVASCWRRIAGHLELDWWDATAG